LASGVFSSRITKHPALSADNFRSHATLGLATVAVCLLLPISINHWIQGQYLLAAGSCGLIFLLSYNIFLVRSSQSNANLNFFLLVPFIVAFLSLAIFKQGVVAVFWCYPVLLSFYCILPTRKACIANTLLFVVVSFTASQTIPFELLTRFVGSLAATSIFAMIMVDAIDRQHKKLTSKIVTDHLTGVFNRSLLEAILDSSIITHRDTKKPMTLLSLDIDHFKNINDTFGHLEGDAVLRSLGELLLARVRNADYVFRVGGEEFLVLLTGSDHLNAGRVAEKIRQDVEALTLLPDCTITVSIGVAPLEIDENWNEWLRRADALLYKAKMSGRNRVVNS